MLKLAGTLGKILMGVSPVSGPEAKFKGLGPPLHLSPCAPEAEDRVPAAPSPPFSPSKGPPLGLDLPPLIPSGPPDRGPRPWASQKKGVKASPEAGAPTGRYRGGFH